MAVFDRQQLKIVLRVVYDGPAEAGKTTNVRQLASFFTRLRRSELLSPEETNGRTPYFDWMDLDGGLVAGHALRCQFLTVPGQRRLARRRTAVLRTADAVVFVLGSSTRSVDRGARMLASLRRTLVDAGCENLPLILQANKQDLKTALGPETLRALLGLPEDVPVVPATASTGWGVRETAVLAIRAAATRVERVLLEQGPDSLVGQPQQPQELLEELRQWDVDATLLHGAALSEPPEEPGEVPAPAAEDAGHASTINRPAPPSQWAVRGPQCLRSEPPRPRHDVPSGCVWPSASGRNVLREITDKPAERRDNFAGRKGTEDGSGSADLLLYQVDGWCLKTSSRRSFETAEAGRHALLELARRKVQLGTLLPPKTVISVQQDTDETCWLWTVTPWLTTLRAEMAAARVADNQERLGAALGKFARAAAHAVTLAAHQHIVLDVHPSNFASDESGLYYIDDDIARGTTVPSLGHALLQRVEEYWAQREATGTYLRCAEEALLLALTGAEGARPAVIDSLEGAIVRNPRAAAARDRLLASIRRRAPRSA